MAKESDSKKTPDSQRPRQQLWWFYAIIFAALIWMWFSNSSNSLTEITWKEFETEFVSSGDVAKLDVVNNERVEVYIIPDSLKEEQYSNAPREMVSGDKVEGPHYFFNIGSVEVFHQELEQVLADIPKENRPTVTYSKREDWLGNILSWVLPLGLLVLFWLFIMRRASSRMGGLNKSMFNFGQSKAREFDKGKKSKVSFDDVAGLEEAKEEIFEMVKFLKDPEKYTRLGAKIPKGILLVGPPGTGKTLLAKAVAGEAGVPFFSLSGSEFVEMFVGVGAARMRDLFDKAKSKAPSIIFIDEIDTVGRKRGSAKSIQSNDERESTLNQLLAELDGFDSDTGVIVLAATNRGDVLDPALLRPGRFDRHVHLELPNFKERQAIFKVHLKPLKLSDDVEAEILARQTPGFSGADIANICNEAALIAARKEKEAVEKEDFLNAVDRVIGGLEKKSKVIKPEEKKRIAYHEAGHVITGWYLKNASAAHKVSIIPRGKSLGAAWYLPEEHQIIRRSQLFESICMALGGRVAEELTFEEVSSNALDDLEKVTKQAYTMVMNYGLSDEFSNISYYDSSGESQQSLHKPYSEKTAERIDNEVYKIVDEAHKKTREVIESHREQLKKLAETLIEKEVIYHEEIKEILGERPKR